ncbi:cytochrome P450 [Lentinula raphanica]|uniref:Cytochrome P450 n=1 Tax=Lentinula raphanica TaxID=153919 RepID=A0AA38U7W6_9AGAR|nr:cytochrome P450 [Lentinula raphanica]KAJ3970351.1 cytochrome P450 [Lentinula raphanica]
MYMLALAVVVIFTYIGALALYRISFLHPLYEYPGPFLAAITNWYEAYYNIVKEGEFISELQRLHARYGPVVRIGPNKLHFSYSQAYHDIYTYGSTLVKEPDFYQGVVAHCPQSSFGFVDPVEAKNRRSLLLPLFSRRAVLALEYTIQQKIDQLLNILKDRHSSPMSPVSMATAYRSLTLDIITSYCFAESTNTLDDPNFYHPLLAAIQEGLENVMVQRHLPILTYIANHTPSWLIDLTMPAIKPFMDLRSSHEKRMDKLLKDPSTLLTVEHETVYHHLLEPKETHERPSRQSLVDEANALIGAGSDTVGNACNIGTFYALKYPSIRKKLTDELHEIWPDADRPVSSAMLENLPYLTAFIKETLRFSLGVVHPLPRVVGVATPEIGGLKIPPGTTVEMSTLFLHMNPEVFPDPHRFSPDRWLGTVTSEMALDLAPFSKGPRICLGMNLAWCELYLIFANVFRRLDLSLSISEKTIEDFSQDHRDYFVPWWKKGYRVFVREVY